MHCDSYKATLERSKNKNKDISIKKSSLSLLGGDNPKSRNFPL